MNIFWGDRTEEVLLSEELQHERGVSLPWDMCPSFFTVTVLVDFPCHIFRLRSTWASGGFAMYAALRRKNVIFGNQALHVV